MLDAEKESRAEAERQQQRAEMQLSVEEIKVRGIVVAFYCGTVGQW